MDYYAVGQRIRARRRQCRLSQEELAERVGISTTHMSHIETANTKLSLPVILSIAEALQVGVDELLRDRPAETEAEAEREIFELLRGCTASEKRIAADVLRTVLDSLRKNK